MEDDRLNTAFIDVVELLADPLEHFGAAVNDDEFDRGGCLSEDTSMAAENDS